MLNTWDRWLFLLIFISEQIEKGETRNGSDQNQRKSKYSHLLCQGRRGGSHRADPPHVRLSDDGRLADPASCRMCMREKDVRSEQRWPSATRQCRTSSGVDIGCGMYTVNLGRAELDFAKIDEAAHVIPSGMNVWEGRQERFDLMTLACSRELKEHKTPGAVAWNLRRRQPFYRDRWSRDGTKYLVIHSGSRNLGKQVAEYYQNLAVRLDRGYDESRENARSSYAPTKSRAAERKSRRR